MTRFLRCTTMMAMGLLTVPATEASAQSNVPEAIEHQGYIEVDGQPYSGNGAFRFALVDGSGNNVWTNDGSEMGTGNMPQTAISLAVGDGVYDVPLGDGTATDAFPANLFANNANLALRVWFDDGDNGVQRLQPDRPIRAVPYARQAERAETAAAAKSVPDVITVDRVEYRTPRKHIVVLGPAEFRPGTSSTTYTVDEMGVGVEGDGNLYAPLTLPVGATLNRVLIYYEDGDEDSNVTVELNRVHAVLRQEETLLSGSTNDESGVGTLVFEELDHRIDGLHAYTLVATDMSNDWETSMKIFNAFVEYSLGEAL